MQSASLLLLLLLCSDIAFNLLHIYQHSFVQDSWNVYGRISAFLDAYHLIKLFWIVVLIIYIFIVSRNFGFIAWLMIFTVMFFDDGLHLHQQIGDLIANRLDVQGLQPRLFELAILAISGIVLLALLAWAYFRGNQAFKRISNDLLLSIVALVFFGLIVDLADALHFGSTAIMGFVIIEDGGEMVVFSLILWYVFLLALHKGKPEQFLLDPIYKLGK